METAKKQALKKGLDRILPEEKEKVHQILQLVTTVLYKSKPQRLYEKWRDEPEEEDDDGDEPDDTPKARRRKRACAARCNQCCSQACYNPLCCCIQCGSFSFFFLVICGVGFAIFFWGTKWLVSLYKGDEAMLVTPLT